MVVRQWQIYTLNLNPALGSEQAGTRPCVVVSANYVNHLNQVVILPITSIKNPDTTIFPNEVFLPQSVSGLSKDSIILAHQIRTIDKQRLKTYVGSIKEASFIDKIKQAMMFHLDL